MDGEDKPDTAQPEAAQAAHAQEAHQVDPAPAAPATAQQFQEVEERMTAFERSTVRWTRVAVLVSILAAVFICLQWLEMREGGVDTHNLATAAGTQATAANDFAQSAGNIDTKIGQAEADFAKMAKNSEATIRATQDSMREDQRAWVGLAGIDGVPQVGSPFKISVHIFNTGRTPALSLHFEEKGITIWEKSGKVFHPDYGGPLDRTFAKEPAETMLFPNQTFQSYVRVSPDLNDISKDVNLAQSDIDILDRRDATVYVFGRVCYRDVFNHRHWLHFCSLYSPSSKGYFSCAEYNEVDNGQNSGDETCLAAPQPN